MVCRPMMPIAIGRHNHFENLRQRRRQGRPSQAAEMGGVGACFIETGRTSKSRLQSGPWKKLRFLLLT